MWVGDFNRSPEEFYEQMLRHPGMGQEPPICVARSAGVAAPLANNDHDEVGAVSLKGLLEPTIIIHGRFVGKVMVIVDPAFPSILSLCRHPRVMCQTVHFLLASGRLHLTVFWLLIKSRPGRTESLLLPIS